MTQENKDIWMEKAKEAVQLKCSCKKLSVKLGVLVPYCSACGTTRRVADALQEVARERDNEILKWKLTMPEVVKSLEKQLSEKEAIITTLQNKLVQEIDPKVWKDGMIESQERKIASLEQKLEKAKNSMKKCANPEEHYEIVKELSEDK